jgi:RNA polymerase sigma-70 factor (ECF subfamily)
MEYQSRATDSHVTDEELMARAGRNDADAFEEIVRRYQKSALGLAWRFLGQQAEAEDLAQEAFLQVYRRARQYQPSIAPFKTWFFTILSNLCRNALKRNKFLSAVELPLDAPALDDPAGDLEEKERRLVVARAIRNLPPNQRLALILCHYEEFSYAEAAATLDLSVKAVESLLVRARRNMRRELSTLGKILRD